MSRLEFYKVQGSGNDFVVLEERLLSCRRDRRSLGLLARKMCDRKFGVGADGLLLLEKSKKADIRMRIFNADGSEAEMCGNGARCCALYMSKKIKKKELLIETKAGLLLAEVAAGLVKLKMTNLDKFKLDMRLRVCGKVHKLDYLNSGVPHVVLEVDDIEDAPVKKLGALIRRHRAFLPAGTNVNFMQVRNRNHIIIRTYERGVEDETLACGTGAVACAVIAGLKHCSEKNSCKVYCLTKSKEELTVYFKIFKNKITDVWLRGTAKIVYKGECYV